MSKGIYGQICRCNDRCIDIQTAIHTRRPRTFYMPVKGDKRAPMSTLKMNVIELCSPYFLLLKELVKPLENLQTTLGMNRLLDISIERSRQVIKKIWHDKCMPWEMNMLIIYHVHQISTEMKGKNLQRCLKAHL